MINLVIISLHVFIFAFAVCGSLFLVFIGNCFTKSGTKMAYIASIVIKIFTTIMFVTYLIMHLYCIREIYFPSQQTKNQKSLKLEKQNTNDKKIKQSAKNNNKI